MQKQKNILKKTAINVAVNMLISGIMSFLGKRP
jgi:hypothetical protein